MRTSGWLTARVADAVPSTTHGRILTLDVPGWPGNDPGQHLDIRLTAPDGYQAERSYSIASFGPGERVEIAVDEIPDGEVSPYLVRDAEPGDAVEVKGPLGAYFVWRPEDTAPTQLIAGGSGIVPLVAMARSHAASGSAVPMRLLYSVRTAADALYRDEIAQLAAGALDLTWAYTRKAPTGWPGRVGRLTPEEIARATFLPGVDPVTFICGPTRFVEAAADAMVAAGHDPARVRTERFGGS